MQLVGHETEFWSVKVGEVVSDTVSPAARPHALPCFPQLLAENAKALKCGGALRWEEIHS